MSNTTFSGGLVLVHDSGMAAAVEMCHVRAADGTALFLGDAVQIDATAGAGKIGQGPAVQDVKASGAGGAVYGVIQAFLPQFADGTAVMNLSQVYRPASTEAYCLVRRANNTDTYMIMDDGNVASGSAGALGLINVGLNANLSVSTSGSTSTGLSNMRLGGASINTTATLQLKIIGVAKDVKNDYTSTFARWLVSINNCQTNTGGTGTAGV